MARLPPELKTEGGGHCELAGRSNAAENYLGASPAANKVPGATRLTHDFAHSEIADIHCIPNLPNDPNLAIAAGQRLCGELLDLWDRRNSNGCKGLWSAL